MLLDTVSTPELPVSSRTAEADAPPCKVLLDRVKFTLPLERYTALPMVLVAINTLSPMIVPVEPDTYTAVEP